MWNSTIDFSPVLELDLFDIYIYICMIVYVHTYYEYMGALMSSAYINDMEIGITGWLCSFDWAYLMFDKLSPS